VTEDYYRYLSCERPNPLFCHTDVLSNDISLGINLRDGLLISRTQQNFLLVRYKDQSGILIQIGIESSGVVTDTPHN
jgi:hypothetical protein